MVVGEATPPHCVREVRIRRRSGDIVCCAPSEIVPRRLGLLLDDKQLVLEYSVPGLCELAHHRISIEAEGVMLLSKEGAALSNAELATSLAQKLQLRHMPWLCRVPLEQLERLVLRFCDPRTPKASCAKPAGKLAVVDHQAPHAAMQAVLDVEAAGKPPTTTVLSPSLLDATPRALREVEAAGLGVLLGHRGSLPREWLQGWCFEKEALHCCPYGLRQAEGGPCGVIAPVQAGLLQRLLMGGIQPRRASREECRAALLDALTDTLLRCAPDAADPVVHVLSLSARPPACTLRSPAGCQVRTFRDRESLRLSWAHPPLVGDYLAGEETEHDKSAGVLLFLYSAMLTCGVERIRQAADEPQQVTMIGGHGYCTQELVNLLLTGTASSNVFDGERALGGGGDSTKLRGIAETPEVGFLSLFEAYEALKVGSFFKRPRWPVWVVHAESHYSVVFGSEASLSRQSSCPEGDEEELDVWYYDPLGRQDEDKRITVRPGRLDGPPDDDDLETNGMIAKVLRTRWGPLAELDWNGAEPIY